MTLAPFLLRRLVTGAISARDLPDSATRVIKLNELRAAESVLMDIVSAADRATQEAASNSAEVWSMAMRTLQFQYHDQLGTQSYLRELWLSGRIVELALTRGVDINECFRNTIGVSYTELATLSFAAYATVAGENSTGVLDPETWVTAESPLAVSADAS